MKAGLKFKAYNELDPKQVTHTFVKPASEGKSTVKKYVGQFNTLY